MGNFWSVGAATGQCGERRASQDRDTDLGQLHLLLDAFLFRLFQMFRGRTKVYEMIAAEDLPVIRIGTSVRVPKQRLLLWIERNTRERSS